LHPPILTQRKMETEGGKGSEGAPDNSAETTFSDAESIITVGSCS